MKLQLGPQQPKEIVLNKYFCLDDAYVSTLMKSMLNLLKKKFVWLPGTVCKGFCVVL